MSADGRLWEKWGGWRWLQMYGIVDCLGAAVGVLPADRAVSNVGGYGYGVGIRGLLGTDGCGGAGGDWLRCTNLRTV